MTKLEQEQGKKTKKGAMKAPQRRITPATFMAIEKSKEISKIKSAQTAEIENHYVNGSFTHSTSNRGK